MEQEADASTGVREPVAGRLPDFFVVGHPKSGTTALYEMLRRQPRIFLPQVKEPWFFVPELRAKQTGRASSRHPDTLDGYLELFADARPDQLAGEATPSYLVSEHAAARIAELCPEARIVAILREPASFLRSLHLQFLQSNVESEPDLRKALELEPRRREGRSLPAHSTRPQALFYSEHVRYVEQLQRYRAAFAQEQMLVLIYDDFRAENVATVERVLDFLGVEDPEPVQAIEVNAAVQARAQTAREGIRSLYLGRERRTRAARGAIKALTSKRMRQGAVRLAQQGLLSRDVAPADERLMGELRTRYKDEVAKLSAYLDRDLTRLWGYDSVVG
jgi:hypothetical protein